MQKFDFNAFYFNEITSDIQRNDFSFLINKFWMSV